MVGVPRSKGCRICVQRRVRCDQTRPVCNNCKKGNRPCPGYGQDLKFQDESQKLRKRYEKHQQPPQHQYETSFAFTSNPTPDLTDDSSVTSPEAGDVGGAIMGTSFQTTGQSTNHWDILGVDVHTSNRRSFIGLLEGKRDQYIGLDDMDLDTELEVTFDPEQNSEQGRNYMFDGFDVSSSGMSNANNILGPIKSLYSPNIQQNQLLSIFRHNISPDNAALKTVPVQMRNHGRWLDYLPPLTGTNKLLDTAVRAVTLVHIGRLNDSARYVNESRPYYGQALQLLNSSLRDRQAGMSNETLCATILLSFYEMFASDKNELWIRHAGGAGALIKVRGPARHRTGFDREIFLAYRYTLVIEAFQNDTACFLAAPEWQALAKSIHNDLKSSGVAPERIAIFDLAEDYYSAMVVLPELTAQADQHYHTLHPDPNKPRQRPTMPRAALIERLQDSRSNFKTTFTRFEAALKAAGHAPTIQLTPRDPVCSINYEFINTFVSSSFTGYWTVLAVLNQCLAALLESQKDLTALYHMENRENALNIMRSTAYALKSSFLGPFFVIFGLRLALNVFEEQGGPECDWVIRKLLEIGERHMGIAKDIPGYASGLTVEQILLRFKKVKVEAAKTEADRKNWERQIQDMEGAKADINSFDSAGMRSEKSPSWDGSEVMWNLEGVAGWHHEDMGDFPRVRELTPGYC